ncbi:MAG: mechanosensitive ion channel [Candidatus Kapaibacteriales bacterium]
MEQSFQDIAKVFLDVNFTLSDILKVIFLFGALYAVLHLLKRYLRNPTKLVKFDLGVKSAIYQILKYFLILVTITSVLSVFGINLTAILAVSTALLVGVGIGLQQTFNDLICGFIILFEGTIHVTDVVEINGVVGRVHEIGIRTSKVRTRDDKILIIPNSHFIVDDVVNWSYEHNKTRFCVKVGVAYGSDTELVRETLLSTVIDNPQISQSPKPFVWFDDFGSSSLDFSLHFWTENIFRVEILKSDIRFAISKAFSENNIRIPFPQRDLHISSVSEEAKETIKDIRKGRDA